MQQLQWKSWVSLVLLLSPPPFPSGYFIAWWLRLYLWRLKDGIYIEVYLVLLRPNYNNIWVKNTLWQRISYKNKRYSMKGFFLSHVKKGSLILTCWRFCAISVECCRPQREQTVRKWLCEGMNNKKSRGFNKMWKYWCGKGSGSIKSGQCMIDDERCAGKH